MSCEELAGYVIGPAGESPPNYDGLPNTNFRLSFKKAAIAVFFLQEFNLPPITVNEVKRPTPFVDTNEIGEKIIYTPFVITFLVDSKLKNFRQLYDWMKRMTVAGTAIDDNDTVTLMIDTAQTVRFVGCWPTSLSSLQFYTNPTGVQYMTATATINYDYLEFID